MDTQAMGSIEYFLTFVVTVFREKYCMLNINCMTVFYFRHCLIIKNSKRNLFSHAVHCKKQLYKEIEGRNGKRHEVKNVIN